VGADFIFQYVVLKETEEEVKKKLLKAIKEFEIPELKEGLREKILNKFNDEKSKEFEEFCEFWESGLNKDCIEDYPTNEELDEITEKQAINYMVSAVKEFFESLSCRDVGSFSRNGEFIYLTGGMSWGENPTESFNTFCAFVRLPKTILKAGGVE